MPSPPRTAMRQWRGANARRQELEAEAVQRARAAVRPLNQEIDDAKARLADVRAAAANSRAVRVVDALFGTTRSTGKRETGAVHYSTVDRRRAETRNDVERYRRASAAASPELEPTSGWPGAAAAWVGKVKPGGEWDDRTRVQKKGQNWRPYEYGGNFSYGATAEALGLPEGVAMWGAGLAQRWQNAGQAVRGEGLNASEAALWRRSPRPTRDFGWL